MISFVPRFWRLQVVVALPLVLAVPACAAAAHAPDVHAPDTHGTCAGAAAPPPPAAVPSAATTAYAGPECDSHRLNEETLPTRKDLFDHLCATGPTPAGTAADAKSSDDTYTAMMARRRGFDDRNPDQVTVALEVIDGAHVVDAFAIGTDAVFAAMFDETAFRAQVGKLDLSDPAKTSFVAAALAAKATLDGKLLALEPRRKRMYIDVQAGVEAARQTYFRAHADAYAKFEIAAKQARDAKLAKKAPREVVAALEGLRRAYFATCQNDDCRFDPFVIEVTRELVLLHAAAGDARMASAENALLQEPAAGRHLFVVESGRALYASMAEEYQSWAAHALAKQEGATDAALTARYGAILPINIDPDPATIGADVLPDLAASIEASADHGAFVVGVVAGVAPAADPKLSTITFRNDLGDALATCFETGRVSSVHYDDANHATLEPEIVCQKLAEAPHFEKRPAAITVPRSEAIGIAPGELLTAAVSTDKRSGVVVRTSAVAAKGGVKTKTPVLQIRGERLAQVSK